MRILLLIVGLLFVWNGYSQTLSEKEVQKFHAAEKALLEYTNEFSNDSLKFEERVAKIHEFIPRFVAILKEPNSFDYAFDSLRTISVITAPDNAFRIFTWQLREPLGTYKYYGALQMNTEELQLRPLFDYSDTMIVHTQMVCSAENWYGGIYYNILLTKDGDKSIYTLLGYDDVDFVSKRKFIETISFDANKEPIFGSPIIDFYDSLGVKTHTDTRFFVEYNDRASAKLNYDEELGMIIYDHVVPPSDVQNDAEFTYIPDGTYEGFKWENGRWVWVEKIFHYSIGKPDSPPMPAPKNNDGGLFGQ